MTDREQLLSLVRELAVVRGRVTLSSGREADYYVDLRRITLSGLAAPLVGRELLAMTADLDFDAVAGGQRPDREREAAGGHQSESFTGRATHRTPVCRNRDSVRS